MIVQFAFGKHGAKATNVVLAITLLGWFGVTAAFFAEAADVLATSHFNLALGTVAWTAIGTVAMIATALFGFRGLDKLSLVVTPLLLVLLVAAAAKSAAVMPFDTVVAYENPKGFPVGAAVSMLVGAWMVGAVTLPDLTRYAITPKQGVIGGSVSFLVGMVMVIVPCAFVAIANAEADIIKVVVSLGWAAWALIIIFLSAWSSNDNNIYSASLSISSLLADVPKWRLTVAAGLLGGVLAALGIMEKLIPFLLMLGILVPPIAGVFAVDFFLNKDKYDLDTIDQLPGFRWQAFVVWLVASGIAFATVPAEIGGPGLFTITMIPAVDALLVSSAGYFVLSKVAT